MSYSVMCSVDDHHSGERSLTVAGSLTLGQDMMYTSSSLSPSEARMAGVHSSQEVGDISSGPAIRRVSRLRVVSFRPVLFPSLSAGTRSETRGVFGIIGNKRSCSRSAINGRGVRACAADAAYCTTSSSCAKSHLGCT